jgi:hypothetical protein
MNVVKNGRGSWAVRRGISKGYELKGTLIDIDIQREDRVQGEEVRNCLY